MIKEFTNSVENIVSLLSEEKKMLQKSTLTEVAGQGEEELDSVIAKTMDTRFTVLVMGKFSSGKSALINVLLGEKVLPEKSVYTTAIITEVCYGEEKKAVLYPKKGSKYEELGAFDIRIDEIAKYATIDNNVGFNVKNGDSVSSEFEKLVLYWPLDLLKENVVIVDSPGTDDPYESERIVNDYLPNADAVIYCIHSKLGYTIKDKNTLEKICMKGFNPIIVTTCFDLIKPASKRPDYIERTKADYSKHVSDEYCHYVDSKLGLQAKANNRANELQSSGYGRLETFLGKFFAERKGREKMSTLVSAVRNYNDNQVDIINNLISAFDSEQNDFDAQIKSSTEALEKARETGENIKESFKLNIGAICDHVITEKIPDLFSTVVNKIDLSGFSSNVSFSENKMREGCKLIAVACSKEATRRNACVAEEWNQKNLFPYLSTALNNLTETINHSFNSFNSYIDKARVRLSVKDEHLPKKITRLENFTINLLKEDLLGSSLGEAQSEKAVGRALLVHSVGAIIIMAFDIEADIVALAFLIGGVIIGDEWTKRVAEKKIRSETETQIRKYYEENKVTLISSASEKCKQKFNNIIEDFNAAIDADIKEAEFKIENIKRERENFATESGKRKAELFEVINKLNTAKGKAEEIGKRYNI